MPLVLGAFKWHLTKKGHLTLIILFISYTGRLLQIKDTLQEHLRVYASVHEKLLSN